MTATLGHILARISTDLQDNTFGEGSHRDENCVTAKLSEEPAVLKCS